MVFRLTKAYVEHIHDELVAQRMPFDEPIDPRGYRDHDKLDSAVNRPFQTFESRDLHPTLFDKAAALFHSVACGHSFFNGNKRTAVMTLDMFLTANSRWLIISNEDFYQLSRDTVQANENGIKVDVLLPELATRIKDESIDFDTLLEKYVKKRVRGAELAYEWCINEQKQIRSHPLNARSESRV